MRLSALSSLRSYALRGLLARTAAVALLSALSVAAHATTATTTTLAISSSTVTAKTVVTLTATVKTGSTPITIGTVLFCDATATYCTDVHQINSAQLIVTAGASQGTAVYKFIPGVGTHTYKAIYVANTTYSTSTSSNVSLTVNQGTAVSSTTTIAQSGSSGNYTLTSTVSGYDYPYPTGTVSFLDTSNSNAVLATAGVTSNVNNPAFTAGATYTAGYAPQSSVTADFNNDGIPDIAVAAFCVNSTCSESTTAGAVYIFLGNGDGTFRAGTTLYAYSLVQDIKIGDFNRDGNIDIVTNSENNTNGPCCSSSGNNYQQMQLFISNGDGTFKSPANFNMPVDPEYMAVADVNNDGYLDVIITGEDTNGLTIYEGNGNGGFTEVTSSAVIPTGVSLTVAAPFAGDGAPDLAMYQFGATQVSLFKNNGTGTYTALTPITLPNSGTASWMTFADMTGDGVLDLLLLDSTNYKLSLYQGTGNGTFSLYSTTSTSVGPSFVGTADFNNDGKADVYIQTVPASGNGAYNIFVGNGSGGLTESTNMPALGTSPYFASVADYNEDGRPDLAAVDDVSNLLTLDLNLAVSTATASSVAVPGSGTHNIEASYPGDGYYAAGTSVTTPLSGSRISTSLAFTANPTSSSFGQSVTLTATQTPYSVDGYSTNGETISFYYGTVNSGDLLGTGTLSGGTASISTTAIPQGSQTLTAVYTQDAANFGGSSKAISFVVSAASPDNTSTAVTTVNPNSISIGATTSLTATVTDTTHTGTTPAGTVTFYDKLGTNTTTVTTVNLSNGSANYTYTGEKAGAHTITASFSPTNSALFNTSTDTTGKPLTVSQVAETGYGYTSSVQQGTAAVITFDFGYPGTVAPTGAVTVTVGGSSANLSGLTCVAKSLHTNCNITYTAPANITPGSYTIAFSQAADSNYTASSGTGILLIYAPGHGNLKPILAPPVPTINDLAPAPTMSLPTLLRK